MMRQSRTRQAGFTLIELLVVVTIIVVLIGLLLAAVNKVLEIGPRADTIARITAINTAIGTFKSQTGAKFIPAGQIDVNTNSSTYGQVIGPFRLMSQYPPATTTNPNDLNVNCFEAQYIARLFNANPSNFGGSIPLTQLDANQTLLFFLGGIQAPSGGYTSFTGFSSNSQAPFTPFTPGSNENRKGPYLDLTPNRYTLDASGFARVIDGYKTPFAYFSAFEGRANLYGVQYNPNSGYRAGDNTINIGSMAGTPLPYQSAQTYASISASSPAAFVNPSGWQIISAGRDGLFGVNGNWSGPPSTDLNYADDLANFSASPLGSGPY